MMMMIFRGCVTPRQILNLKEAIEDNLDLFDGYDELPEDIQEKMRRALEQGHVDDEDWKGVSQASELVVRFLLLKIEQDSEYNRPGMNGFRKRTPKKKATQEEVCTEETMNFALPFFFGVVPNLFVSLKTYLCVFSASHFISRSEDLSSYVPLPSSHQP